MNLKINAFPPNRTPTGGRDGNGYTVPAYPAGENPIRARVWDQRKPMGI